MLYLINSIENVKKFVKICEKYQGEIFVYSPDGYIVNGKSIMGIFSLDLTQPLRISIEDKYEENHKFYKDIKIFLV